MTIFETERLLVRYFTEADKENYFSLSGDYEVMQYIRAVKTKEESDAYLEQIIRDSEATPSLGRWAVDEKDTGTFVGSFAIIPMATMPERIQLGYSLTPGNWGKGYATELTREGLKFFMDRYPLPEIYAVTEKLNTASQKVLLKAGCQPAGTVTEDEKELYLFIVDRESYNGSPGKPVK